MIDVAAPFRAARTARYAPPLLRENVAFRRFFAGQAVSLVGDQVSLIALPLVGVLVLHAGAAQMGYLTTAALLPNLLFSLHAGAWVDRRGRRREVMLAADLGRAALLASIPIAYAFDLLTIEQLYVVGFLEGLLSVFFYVAYSTLFVALVPRERYIEANQLLHGSRALSFVGGPSLGGILVQILSAPAALAADAVSFLVSAFSLSRISPVEPPTEPAEHGHLRAGASYIRHSPVIRASLLATATINFFNFVFFALVILYANRYLHIQPGRARDRDRRRVDRERDRIARDRADRPSDRDRARLCVRLPALPGAARARAARRRAAAGSSSAACSSPSSSPGWA